ncbi:MAG: polyhydroxyalkanoate synthesis regulator DNA-binding domain-containing protein, partial [Rhodocyclaceae bacterium]
MSANNPTNNTTINETNDNVRLIKKYPNRRLYDTKNSAYITITEIKNLVL